MFQLAERCGASPRRAGRSPHALARRDGSRRCQVALLVAAANDATREATTTGASECGRGGGG